ncbi:MAG: sugar ABC transporter permease [Anaerolineae bacterium]|nr:sugar ABC transporter permease [Anaerolineae bacterium]MDW8071367.1 sugar ABC transporter permease [Anaerolineae bacterium]
MTTERVSRSALAEVGIGVETRAAFATRVVSSRLERMAGNVFILPAVLVVLFLSIFPLFLSLSLSLSRLKFVKGGFEINFVGLANYHKLLFGSEQDHFVGVIASPSPFGWAFFLGVVAFLVWRLVCYIRAGGYGVVSLIGRVLAVVLLGLLAWLLAHTLSSEGRPGTVVVTLLYVFIGIAVQYALGLLLAVLTTQRLPARRFFRVVFLLPMMITPVGIAYTFRMMTDTDKGPFQPIWQALGLGLYSWVNDPWGARAAVIISDIWQWTPFMFIVLLAAMEGQSVELIEAALVDGANRWQVFWHITLPQILPVSTTLILIRMIEAFKIVDLPNVLTNGGPGTATESMTLHAFIAWRTLDLGGSAAIAYMLLFLVTFLSMSYVNILRRRVVEV